MGGLSRRAGTKLGKEKTMKKWDFHPDRNCTLCGGLGRIQYGPIDSPADPMCSCWAPRLSQDEAAAVEDANRLLSQGDLEGYQRTLSALADQLETE